MKNHHSTIFFFKKTKSSSLTWLFLLHFSLLTIFSCAAQKKVNFSNAISQSEKLAEDLMRKEKISGMAVAVSHQGKMVWSKGFGFSNQEEKIPADPMKTKFRIGSVSKPLTAAALAHLYEDGKIDLDAPIQKYVPYFPKKEYDITLRQLGGHLAGIRHYHGFEFMNNKYYPTVKEGIDIFKDSPLLQEPGTKYSYSSYGWNLISAAIEGASGEAFLTYVQKTVFTPLKLNNTMAEHSTQDIPNLTNFYMKNGNDVVIAPTVDNSYKWAGGGFLSTAEDMIVFGNAMLGNDFLKKETKAVFLENQKTKNGKPINYGIGFRVGKDKKDRSWFGHSGGSVGGTTYLIMYPDSDLVVIVLANMSQVKYDNLPFKIANQFLSGLE